MVVFTINDIERIQYRVPEFHDPRSHCIILLTIIISRVLPIFVHFGVTLSVFSLNILPFIELKDSMTDIVLQALSLSSK